MSDFFERVLQELKAGRLTRQAALDLIARRASAAATPDAAAGAKAFDDVLLVSEEWQPAPFRLGRAAAIGRAVCVCGASARAAMQAAFAAAAPQTTLEFVPFESSADPGGSAFEHAFAAIRAHAPQLDALAYWADTEHALDGSATEEILSLLQALRRSDLRCTRLLLAAVHDDAVSRCHAESWLGIVRTLRVLAPEMPAAVLLAEREGEVASALHQFAARVVQEVFAERMESANYLAQRRHALRRAEFAPAPNATRLRAGATVLITGGAGALGFTFARELAQRYGAKLVLTGRSALDATRTAHLDELRASGAEIVYEAVDVADLDAMRACVRRIRARFGALNGVIHAAGVQGEGLLFDNPLAQARAVLRPKVSGTLVLEQALRDCHELEFFCNFASNAAVLGDFGSFDYAVANRFQMAFGQCATPPPGRTVLSIGWPFWQGTGMGSRSDPERTRLYLESTGQRALDTARGFELFEGLLHAGGGFRMVLCGEAARLRQTLEALDAAPAAGGASAATPARRRAVLRGLDLAQCVAFELSEQIEELLKLSRSKILPRQNLTEFGFESITLARWAKRIAQHYAIEFSPAVFFSHPTLQQVVAYLLEHHTVQIAQRYREAEAEPAATAPEQALAANPPAPETERVEPAASAGAEPIAIVGIAGRFPQSRNADELWQILVEGRDAISEIPLDRFDWRPYFARSGDDPARMSSKWLGVLPGVDEFDPLFFEISPREAQNMDPRQRLLLQEAWNALEDAGYGDAQLERERIGMFVGAEQGEYHWLAGAHSSLTGNHDAVLASRLLYALDLHGPALTINTSCSSGLVAAHQACLSLRSDDCDAAIAAAANLMLTPHPYLGMSHAGMLSAQGRCRAFAVDADGMVPGEAVVALVLKRLSHARADGDPIHAVIVASGINYDGKTNGITAPNGAAQAQLIADVYARAGISAASIDYVIAHGTATRLGDPVEVAALDRAFGAHDVARGACALTSIKSNLGHTFAASGLVGVVGMVLALRHETIPASLYCERPSDHIDWARSAFRLNRSNSPWPRDAARRRFGALSAFGMSGTNAHMVLRDDDASRPDYAATAPAFLLALSAANETALRQRVRDLADYMRAQPAVWSRASLAALSYTLLAHRKHLAQRCAVIVEDADQALALLDALWAEQQSSAVARGRVTADFSERPALRRYAASLLESLPAQETERATYRESLAALADLYCQGYRFDWRALFGSAVPERLRLPAYPFARQRYWVEPDAAATVPIAPAPTKALPDETHKHDQDPAAAPGVQYVVPHWETALEHLAASAAAAFECASARVLVVGGSAAARTAIQRAYPHVYALAADAADSDEAIARALCEVDSFEHVIWIAPACAASDSRGLIEAPREGVLRLLRLVRAVLARVDAERALAWTVVTFGCVEVHKGAGLDPTHAGVHGLIGSVAKECAHWSIRLLDFLHDADWEDDAWTRVPADARARPWARREGRWHRQQLVALQAPAEAAPSTLAHGGVYVLVGGAGHIGRAWTEHMIRTRQARVIWLGRRAADDHIRAEIARLGTLGVAPDYIAVDAADAAALERAHAQIKRAHGRIDGVVLSTILLEPRPLAQTDVVHLLQALRAKVDVSVNVLEVFAREPLRMVLFFSSMIAFIRNPLQGPYAAGCAFADAFARSLQRRWRGADAPCVKIINWGFWNRAENLQLEGFAKMAQMGIGLIESDEGMRAFEHLLAEPLQQLGVVKLTKPLLIEGMNPKTAFALQPQRTAPDMAQLARRARAAAQKEAQESTA